MTTIQDRILNHKIGVFELLFADIPVEIIFGSRLRVIIVMAMCVLASIAKSKFKGEFSLVDIGQLFTDKEPEKPSAN